jgi:CRISPR-associated endonuclease/helicase Cas3
MDVNQLRAGEDRFLIPHLLNVANLCERFADSIEKKLNLPLKKALKFIGLLHDFGKATLEFQKKINKERNYNRTLAEHSLISAFLVYIKLKEEFNEDFLPFLGYIAVKRHHGELKNIEEEFCFDEDSDKYKLQRQLDLIGESSFQEILKALNISLDYKEILERLNNFKEELWDIKDSWDDKEKDLGYYFLLNLMVSILTDADRYDACFPNSEFKFAQDLYIESSIVDRFKEGKFLNKSWIDNIREKAYIDGLNNLEEWTIEDKILSLTLPTGCGKTILAFKIALVLQERLQNLLNEDIRIIYALPFLSIIDQNFSVIKEILKEPTSDVLIAHHHLIEAYYKFKDEDYKPSQSWFLIEGWNAKIIVTTFVQLFDTLFTNKPSILRRFHRLFPSIIILDEVQNLPAKYWELFKESALYLSKKFDIYWLLVTATQPAIFDKSFECIKFKENYFSKFDRVRINFKGSMKIEELSQDLEKLINSKSKLMIIVNTISDCRRLYNFFKEKLDENRLGYLSSHIIPLHRRQRIKEIKDKLAEPFYFILITTQLVEAGIDLDFDQVWRDIAPWDCLVQSAGRCNREYKKDKGKFNMFCLYDERRKRERASYIYDATLLNVSEEIINEYLKEEISEPKFVDLIEKYFSEIKRKSAEDSVLSNEYINAMKGLKYEEISKFSLIEEEPQKIDVFIE